MRKVLTSALAVIVCVFTLSAQDTNWKKTLEQQLQEIYPVTKLDTGLFAAGATIKKPGVVLIVQQAGILAGDEQTLFVRSISFSAAR